MFVFSLAVGPIQCKDPIFFIGVFALALLSVILLLSWACVCYTYMHAKCDRNNCDTCIFSYACILVLALIAAVVTISVFVFSDFESYTSNCKFAVTPFAALSFSFFLITLYCFVSFCCLCGPILYACFC